MRKLSFVFLAVLLISPLRVVGEQWEYIKYSSHLVGGNVRAWEDITGNYKGVRRHLQWTAPELSDNELPQPATKEKVRKRFSTNFGKDIGKLSIFSIDYMNYLGALGYELVTEYEISEDGAGTVTTRIFKRKRDPANEPKVPANSKSNGVIGL
jgi:hypothetical protein